MARTPLARLANVLVLAVIAGLAAPLATAQPAARDEMTVTSDSPPGWSPTLEQQAEAQRTLDAFLAAMDAGRFAAAYALTNASFRNQQPQAAFAKEGAQTRAQLGQLLERRLLHWSWSKDPKEAPEPGVYVAVDFSSRFAEADRSCGYVVLRQPPEGGPFQVNNLLHAFVDNKTARDIVKSQSISGLDAAWATASSACPNQAARADEAPLPEDENGVGYASVAAALADLRTRPGVKFRTENGWTVAEDMKNRTIWSFAPAGHPAYPSAVKRQLVEDGAGTSLGMSVSCEATKEPCDALVREFEQLNNAALSGGRKGR